MLPYLKAFTAAGVAFFGSLTTALLDGHVTPGEWAAVGGSVFAALAFVFTVPNIGKDGSNAAGH